MHVLKIWNFNYPFQVFVTFNGYFDFGSKEKIVILFNIMRF